MIIGHRYEPSVLGKEATPYPPTSVFLRCQCQLWLWSKQDISSLPRPPSPWPSWNLDACAACDSRKCPSKLSRVRNGATHRASSFRCNCDLWPKNDSNQKFPTWLFGSSHIFVFFLTEAKQNRNKQKSFKPKFIKVSIPQQKQLHKKHPRLHHQRVFCFLPETPRNTTVTSMVDSVGQLLQRGSTLGAPAPPSALLAPPAPPKPPPAAEAGFLGMVEFLGDVCFFFSLVTF